MSSASRARECACSAMLLPAMSGDSKRSREVAVSRHAMPWAASGSSVYILQR